MRHVFKIALISLTALAASACSAPEEMTDSHAGMHGSETEAVALAPLTDDGIEPVISMRAVWMRPHPNGRDVTAAYFVARLEEGSADRFVSARIDGAERVELHGHVFGDDGMMQMRAIGPQDLLASGPLIFTPGGRHLMVHGLETKTEGDEVNGVLVFERAGEIAVTFEVQSTPPGMPTEF
jgi:copper(I)-binding protein